MKIKLKNIAIVSVLLISSQVNAELIETDWKSNGDKLATLDVESGIEWLDLSLTRQMTVNQVISKLDSDFKGWRLPTRQEVLDFMSNNFESLNFTGRNQITSSKHVGTGEISGFISRMGLTDGSIRSYGLYINDLKESSGGTDLHFSGSSTSNVFYDFESSFSYDETNGYYGVYLVSDGGTTISSIENPSLNINNPNAPINQVPIGATASLLIAGLLFSRKKLNTVN